MFLLIIFFMYIILPMLCWRGMARVMRVYYHGGHTALRWVVPLLACVAMFAISLYLGWLMLDAMFSDIGRAFVGPT